MCNRFVLSKHQKVHIFLPLLQSLTGIGRHYSAGEWRDGEMDGLQVHMAPLAPPLTSL